MIYIYIFTFVSGSDTHRAPGDIRLLYAELIKSHTAAIALYCAENLNAVINVIQQILQSRRVPSAIKIEKILKISVGANGLSCILDF